MKRNYYKICTRALVSVRVWSGQPQEPSGQQQACAEISTLKALSKAVFGKQRWDEWANPALADRAACCRFRLYLPSWVPCSVTGDAPHRQHGACGRGWLGGITEQPPRACCSFTQVKKGRSQAQTSLPFKGSETQTSSTLAHHPPPRLPQRTCCTRYTKPWGCSALPSKHCWPSLLTSCVPTWLGCGQYFRREFFFISWGVLNEVMLNNFCGLGSSYWFPFPFAFAVICSDAREEVFIILNNLVFTMPAISHWASRIIY